LREIRRATRHHGITTTAELDLSQRQIDTCCSNGTLVRLHEGVYADPAHPRSPVQLLAAGVAAGGERSAAWGRSSAAVWELCRDHPPRPEIVVPYGRIRRIDGVSVHRSRALTPEMLTMRNHIRVTKPLIAVIDCGVPLSPAEVGELIIVGRQKRLFSIGDVHETIDRYARPGRTGISVAREAVSLIMIDGRPADSVLEFRFHIGPGQQGLPPYRYQYKVHIGGRRYRIDFAYPEVLLAIEVDGYEFHSSKEAVAYGRERRNQLVFAGWTVLTFGWDRVVNDPVGVAIEILTMLGRLGYGRGPGERLAAV
jgi:very-short-patch-repair endonuclease